MMDVMDLVILCAVICLIGYIIYTRKKDLEEIFERTKKEFKEQVEDLKKEIEKIKK